MAKDSVLHRHNAAYGGELIVKRQEVIFKGTSRGLRVVLNAQVGVDRLKYVLRQKLAEHGDFYSGARVTVETSGAVVPLDSVREVEAILEEYGLRVQGVEDAPASRAPRKKETAAPAPVVSGFEPDHVPSAADTVMIKKNLRAGQSVAFDGNVVIMGDVNPGAEVSATGDIVVWGSLRGVAHAGINGDNRARVVALKLIPTQVRIANKITRAPDGEAQAPSGPEIAYVKGDSIVIEPWTSNLGMVYGS